MHTMPVPTHHAIQMNYENLSITIQASGKSVESLLAKFAHVEDCGEAPHTDAMMKGAGGEAPHTDEIMKEVVITMRDKMNGIAKHMDSQRADIDAVERRIEELERSLANLRVTLDAINTVNTVNTVTIKEEAEATAVPAVVVATPVIVAPVPALEEVRLTGHKRTRAEVEEEETVEAEEEVVEEEVVEEEEEVVEEVEETVEEEVVEEEVVEEEVVEEEMVEEVVEEEVEEVVEEEVEEVVEEEESEAPHEDTELELEEFDYNGGIYYKDQFNKVYALDFEMEITEEPVGTYNPKTGKVTLYPGQ